PGDPQLLTLKAVSIVENCPVIIAPHGSKKGNSTALAIVGEAVPLAGKTVVQLHFPMKKIRSGHEPVPEILAAWRHAAEEALHHLNKGINVCFPTLGDPAIYSTGYYLYETVCGIKDDVNVEFVPGVPAMSSCSAALASPICLGDEMVAVIPATFSDDRLREVLERFDTIVLMKVHRVMDRLVELLKRADLMDRSVLVEKAGTAGQRTCTELDKITDPPHYYSTIIVRKNPITVRTLIN
ncbi:MAG: precorrin-2 C(20)-methyltransferase, partial [Desulfofustis sp.]|nr:precorrin-2 C(20)-methyltransferase [Desulfofustis sp.]